MSGASGDARCYISKASISMTSAGPDEPLADSLTGLSNQNYPRIASNGNRIGVVCRQTINGTGQLPFFYSDDITADPLNPAFDTIGSGNITNADVLLTQDAVHIVWQDDNSETVKYRSGLLPVLPTNIADASTKESMAVYPVPAHDYFIIRSTKKIRPESIRLSDIAGRAVQVNFTVEPGGIRCSTASLGTGVYFLYVRTDDGVHTGKRILKIGN
jgi:hypothetical protein